jgi:hypothetical protein
MRIKSFLILLLSHLALPGFSKIVTYSAPACSITSKVYLVKVREPNGTWQNVDAYKAGVIRSVGVKNTPEIVSFAYFDCSDRVEVSVTVTGGQLKTVRIRPSISGIKPVIKGNTIYFFINPLDQLSIEVNGDIFHNLHLFANPLEQSVPSPLDTNVLYYESGVHHVGRVHLSSGKTVYIAGGAVVKGSFMMDHAENVTIRGRGILTQVNVGAGQADSLALLTRKNHDNWSRNDELTVNYSKHVRVEGIMVIPNKYSLLIGQSTDVDVQNFKSFSSGGNADGIDIFCSANIRLDHIFMRNADDCIAIYGHRWNYYGNTRNVLVTNANLWADMAHPVLIGTHGDTEHPDTLEAIKFEHINVLDQHENQIDYQGCLALNAGDSNLIREVVFNDVRVDDIRKGQLVNLRVMYNRKYNTSPGKGIENVIFRNVTYNADTPGLSVIAGYDESRAIKNIVFENLVIGGNLITDDMKGKPGFYKTSDMANIYIGEHADGVKFIKTTD